jgi:hypothetical protein
LANVKVKKSAHLALAIELGEVCSKQRIDISWRSEIFSSLSPEFTGAFA